MPQLNNTTMRHAPHWAGQRHLYKISIKSACRMVPHFSLLCIPCLFFLIRSSLFCLRFKVKEHENEANAKKLNYLDSQRAESGGRVVCEREKERERHNENVKCSEGSFVNLPFEFVFEKFTWPLFALCLPARPPLSFSLSLLSRFLCLPSATAILLCLFFAPTWLRCFGNADNISCASAAVGSALATAAPALPLPLFCAAAALSPSLVLAGNSTDSFVSLLPPSPPVLRFCGCHNRRQFYLCCFMSTLTRALMRSYTHTRAHTRTHTERYSHHTLAHFMRDPLIYS